MSLMQKTPSENYLPADISVRDVQQLNCFGEQVIRTSQFPYKFTPFLLSSSSCTPVHNTRVHCLVCVCSSQAFVTPICTAACFQIPTLCRAKDFQFPKTSPGGTQHLAIADARSCLNAAGASESPSVPSCPYPAQSAGLRHPHKQPPIHM